MQGFIEGQLASRFMDMEFRMSEYKKQIWNPGNMLYPLPVVMVSVTDKEGNDNIITIAWAGTTCSDPAMVSISVRPERYSYQMLKDTGEFVINLPTKDLCFATDYCGVKSGRNVDKFKELGLTKQAAKFVRKNSCVCCHNCLYCYTVVAMMSMLY